MSATPMNAVVLGASGAGKSVFVNDLLTQTDPLFALTAIIDYGLSYETFTRMAGPATRPFILRPNGNITINGLDSKQLPITPEHLANASALVAMMAGRSGDEDRQSHRLALIRKYIGLLYADVFEEWARAKPGEALEVARLACALQRRQPGRQGQPDLDAYLDFSDWQRGHAEEAQALFEAIPEADVLKTLKDPSRRQVVRHLAFARFSAPEYPTLSMLQELMQLDATTADREQAGMVALQLLAWGRTGSYGVLFDGATNIDLAGRVVHFELGQIPESAPALRAACTALVTSHIHQHIFTLDRSLRKRIVFEECSAFLNIPNADAILRQAYEQSRKFNTWIVAVFQQYERIRNSPIRAALLGNSRQFFLFKQHDPQDIEALAADLGLSPSAVEAVRGFALPEGDKASSFLHVRRAHPHPLFGTVTNRLSREMLYASSSSGADFEQRRKELAGAGPDLLQRIRQLTDTETT